MQMQQCTIHSLFCGSIGPIIGISISVSIGR